MSTPETSTPLTSVPPALYQEADTIAKFNTLASDLKLDAPTAAKLFTEIRKGDRLSLLPQIPGVLREGEQLVKDVSGLWPMLKSGVKTSEFWFAVAAVVGPEIESLVNKPMGAPEHVAVLALAGIVYAARSWAKTKQLV
jgi:hypothetical protein